MQFYSPSSFSQGYPSYPPRQSYRPAPYFLHDESSSGYSSEDTAYPILLRASPPRVDAAARYRRALHELEAAEQDFEAHIALERARQVAIARRRAAAAEAARRERALAIQAEIERIQHASALQAQAEERLAQRQRPLRARAAFGQSHRQGRDLLRALLDGDAEGAPVPQCCSAGSLPTRPQPAPSPARDADDDALTLGDLLKMFAGVHPEPQPAGAPERPTSPPSRPHHPVEQPQPQPESPKEDGADVTLTDILELLHGIGSRVIDAAGRSQSTHQPSVPPQADAAPADGKGKAKAKAEPVPEPTFLQTLLHDFMTGAPDREMRDVEQAIKLSLQDHDAADAKKVRASSPGASSSKVKVEQGVSSGRTAGRPISPLTAIRAARTQFSALESAFKFPPALDYNDHSELAVSANNAPVRAYEKALNGLLEHLDAIESDGDEEIRDVRREGLEVVERMVEERAPRATAVANAVAEEGAEGFDVGKRKRRVRGWFCSCSCSRHSNVPPAAAVDSVPEEVKLASPDVAPAVSPADVDIDQAIHNEYQSTRPPVAVVAEGLDHAGAADGVGVSSTPSAPNADSNSDAVAVAAAAGSPTPAPNPALERFLASLLDDQFPPKPNASHARTGSESGGAQDGAVLAYGSSEGEEGSAKGADDGWSEVYA
ncbi:hypothetical protein BC826DRAFT_1022623 [Russula brevipes]|nr:hypothetical protein BC826DRAFT_1022623 [Russula brevipes]